MGTLRSCACDMVFLITMLIKQTNLKNILEHLLRRITYLGAVPEAFMAFDEIRVYGM